MQIYTKPGQTVSDYHPLYLFWVYIFALRTFKNFVLDAYAVGSVLPSQSVRKFYIFEFYFFRFGSKTDEQNADSKLNNSHLLQIN